MTKKKQVVLLQLIGPQKTQTFDIDKSEFVLGRGETSAVPISENGISREHLKVRMENNLIQIQDLNSSNGTFVNDRQIDSNVRVPLSNNDIVRFGESTRTYKVVAPT